MKGLLIHNKSYLLLWISTLTTRLGNALTITVLMYYIGTQSHSPMMISLVLFAQMMPMVLIGIFAGSVADRLSKFAVMIGSETFQLMTVSAMIFNLNHPWILIFLIFLQGLGAAFYGPAKTAYLSNIVDKEELPVAIGLSQGITQATDLIGPPIAGTLLLLIQSGQILMIDVLTFILSGLFIFCSSRFVKNHEEIKDQMTNEHLWTTMINGLKKVSNIHSLRFLIIIVFVLMLVAGVFNATSVAIELQIFHVTGFQYGLLESVSGIGAIAGSLTGPLLVKHIHPGKFIIVSGIILGFWMTLICLVQFFYPISGIVLLFVWVSGLGLLNSCLNIPVSSLFLVITPMKLRGRAVGILQMFSFLGAIIGLLTGGALSIVVGVIQVTIIAGVLMVSVSVGLIRTRGYEKLIHIHRSKVEEIKNDASSVK